MISNKLAEKLLKLPKHITHNHEKLDVITINQPTLWNFRYNLVGELENENYEFLWVVFQSKKNLLKMSLHVQENDTKIGILRIDFWSAHTNPQSLNESVPIKFHPYQGMYFALKDHHVHYHVEGYPTLAWAIPISDDTFAYKETSNKNIPEILEEFAKVINIQTKLTINRSFI